MCQVFYRHVLLTSNCHKVLMVNGWKRALASSYS